MPACDKQDGVSWPVWNAMVSEGCDDFITPLPPPPVWPRHVLPRDVLD